MKIKLLNSDKVDFNCLDELNKVIPEEVSGEPLNYGQGEGQVRIANTVWAVYCESNFDYCMQYEEGNESWSEIQSLVNAIVLKINKEFNVELQLELEGPFTNHIIV